MASRARKIALASLLAVLTAGACAGLLLGYLVFDVKRRPFERRAVQIDGDLDIRADEEIGYVAAGHAQSVFELERSGLVFAVYNDAIGARVNDPGETTPARVDLVTLGGSVAWGWGLSNEETFTERLRRELGIRVANLAVRGHGTVQASLLLRRHLELCPRVVVYAYIPDHGERNLRPCAPSLIPFCKPVPYVALDESRALFIHPPRTELSYAGIVDGYLRHVLTAEPGRITAADLAWRARMLLSGLETRSMLNLRHATRGPDIERRSLDFLLARMAADASAIGARLLLFHVPPLQEPRLSPPPPRLADLARSHDARFVDFSRLPGSRERRRGRRLTFALDPHPNARAHRLMAEALVAPVGEALARAAAPNGAAPAPTPDQETRCSSEG